MGIKETVEKYEHDNTYLMEQLRFEEIDLKEYCKKSEELKTQYEADLYNLLQKNECRR